MNVWIAVGIGLAFVLGVILGWHWSARSVESVMDAAQSAAKIAESFCDRGIQLHNGAARIEKLLEGSIKALEETTATNKDAAKRLDALDRSVGVMLNAWVRAGLIGTTGSGSETGGGGKGENPYTG